MYEIWLENSLKLLKNALILNDHPEFFKKCKKKQRETP